VQVTINEGPLGVVALIPTSEETGACLRRLLAGGRTGASGACSSVSCPLAAENRELPEPGRAAKSQATQYAAPSARRGLRDRMDPAPARKQLGSSILASPSETGRRASPESIEEALARSLQHARNALSEALLSASALIDAASLATSAQGAGPGPQARPGGSSLSRTLDELARKLAGKNATSPTQGGLTRLLDALEGEIARWEMRAEEDPDARTVLRAFLGLREIIWEIQRSPEERDCRKGDHRQSDRPASGSEPQERSASAKPVRVRG